ncbi:acid protease [Aureobasidium sp. EXF-3400]|nr:acid protease [Aureobasidium sp. EXF-12344]KAI4771984.1 acid protease [Aureobasidium sp. EXF-3400]
MKLSGTLSSLPLLLCCARAAKSDPKTIELALMSSVGNLDGFEYYVNFTVGTPGQLQTVFIDTGSSNTIIFASNASFCEASGCHGGTFDLSKSSTYEKTDPGAFKTSFMMGRTWFKGDYARDVVQMSLMGLGYSSNMSDRKRKKDMPPTFLEGLVQAGAIPSRLYSIYMNTLDRYGSILFGGVDTDKYKGPLTTLNLLPARYTGKVDDFNLYLEEIKMQPFNEPSQTILRSTNESRYETSIDTGTPDWWIPTSAYQEVLKYAGGEPPKGVWAEVSSRHRVRPCSEVARGIANTTYFEITFAGNGSNTARLRLELADLFSPVTEKDGSAAIDGTGQPLCFLRVLPSDSVNDLLTSSSVMRAGYWIFDLDNGQISLAQANLGANSSNVVQVEAGPEGLKKAAKNLRAETQMAEAEGRMPVSKVYELSTATSTIGYATGTESYPTPTGAGTPDPSSNRSPSRHRGRPHVRRAENAATSMASLEAYGFWVLCAAVIVAVGTVAI